MLELRDIKPEDSMYFERWWQDPELIGLTSGDFSTLTDEALSSYFAALVTSETALHYIIDVNSKAVGHISLVQAGEKWWELQIIIGDPSYRGRGYGPNAIRKLFAIACDKGINNIFLNVRPTNTHAIESYEKVGFKKVGDTFETGDENQPLLDRMELII